MTGAMDVIIYALMNPGVQVAVVVPTTNDLVKVAFGGISGIFAWLPKECLMPGRGIGYNAQAKRITLYNGSKIFGFSAEKPDRLRGFQCHRAWGDELSSWAYYDTFDQLVLTLRLGANPRLLLTTTPKTNLLVREARKAPGTVITRGSIYDNKDNLSPKALKRYERMYRGTRLEKQELYGEFIDNIEGALWNIDLISQERRRPPSVHKGNKINKLPDFRRVVVAIDPAVTFGEDSDETGIVVAAKDDNGQFYVLEDASMKGTPDAWARRAVTMYHKWNADRVVAEVNNGGDLVQNLVKTIDRNLPYTAVRASRGKAIRAEPVSALYEQRRVHHVGVFEDLETQMTEFVPGEKMMTSPDRMDAMVWAITSLNKGSGVATTMGMM